MSKQASQHSSSVSRHTLTKGKPCAECQGNRIAKTAPGPHASQLIQSKQLSTLKHCTVGCDLMGGVPNYCVLEAGMEVRQGFTEK